ncbi:MAG TPA: Gfo/Idh/MocA family oxidoreductase [Candidatus Acidoferrum sp.]|jgi:predicted dehydrogenase
MPAGRKIGFAVVGLGSIAKSSVLPAFKNCKKAKLVAMIGRDKKSAEAIARKFRVGAAYGVADYAVCLANPEISAIYIATPQGEHVDLTVQAAQHGKHVLCEKPLAATVAQAEAMVEACRTNGVRLMTAYRKYFEPSCLYVKKLIQDGTLGRIDVLHTAFSELHVPGVSLDWLLDSRMAGGGPLMDLGVYCVNTCRWLVGEDPIEASAHAWRNDKTRFHDVEEGITFRLQFPSGLVLLGSSSYGAVLSSFIFVQGTKGWLSLAPAFPFDEVRVLTGKINGRLIEKEFRVIDEFAVEIDAFAEAILKNQLIEPDGLQGLRDLKIIHTIYEATKSQESISIKY